MDQPTPTPTDAADRPSSAPDEGPPRNEGQPPASISRSALGIVFLVVFIDLLGFGIVLPLLPVIADTYAEAVLPSGTAEWIVEGLIVGGLMSCFSLMQFVFAPIWGRISDRVGRRPILLLGLMGSVVSYALLGYAASLPAASQGTLALILFFAARIGAGVAGATIATAQAVIADCTPPEKRKHGMALIGAAFGIGFTFGPLIGYGATAWFPGNYAVIGYSAALLSVVALVLGLRLLPETRRFEDATQVRPRGSRFAALQVMFGNRSIGPIVLTFFLATLGFAAFEVTLALFLKEVLGFQPGGGLLLMFAYVGLVLMLTQGFLYRRLAKRLTEATFMLLGILGMSLGVGTLALVCWLEAGSFAYPTMPLLFTALTFAVIGFAFLTPSAQALISRRSSSGEQGEVLGVNQSASALARIIGPVLGVPLYKATADHLLPYAFGAAVLLLMLPVVRKLRREEAPPG